jgi:hypothetical protein
VTASDVEQPVRVQVDNTAQFAQLNLDSARVSSWTPGDSAMPDDNDIASVSTETEDDPVNMAMRATLGDGSSMGDEDEMNGDDVEDEDEEQMVWGGR